jgi:mannose-1-phosphate guanylyltransferase/mannose-6-phosphate isomerase
MYAVILAGGVGSRFWPISREQSPKQLQSLTGSGTMIQNTMSRLLPLASADELYVITNEQHALETCKQLQAYDFPSRNLVAEPVGRNTSAAIALAAQIIAEQDDDAILGIFPADHVITDEKSFLHILKQANEVAEKGHLVTLGIKPTRPETGYGYIKKGPGLTGFQQAFQVDRFVEKPNNDTAKKFLDSGEYFWNCGVFIAKASVLLQETQTYLAGLSRQLDSIKGQLIEKTGRYPYRYLNDTGKTIYQDLQSISFDHGILEHSSRVCVVPADVGWSDVGTWDALADVLDKDSEGNISNGDNVIMMDCADTIIQGEKRLIAGLGLKNLIVVDSPDALLVCDKNRAQEVKQIVEKLKSLERKEVEVGVTVQKPWGSYTNLEKGGNYLVKRLDVLPGEKLSMQSHKFRSEHWTIVTGTATVILDGETKTLRENESIFIPQGSKHRLGNLSQSPLSIIEVQIGSKISEDDIQRYEDLYNR